MKEIKRGKYYRLMSDGVNDVYEPIRPDYAENALTFILWIVGFGFLYGLALLCGLLK